MSKTLLTLATTIALILSTYASLSTDQCTEISGLSPNATTGIEVAKLHKHVNVNPEELGHYYEGDILIPSHKLCKNATNREQLLWPGGRLYYEISSDFDDTSKAQIRKAMTHISERTCITFVPRSPDQPDYVKFTADKTGCWTTAVGRLGGEQIINLQAPSCLQKMGSVVHQLVHALGIGHEHNRPDRNQHIDVLWANVNETHRSKFDNTESHTDTLDLPYDPHSIMHYSPNAFAKDNQLNTLKPKIPGVHVHKIGQRDGLSHLDALKIDKLYKNQCFV